MGVLIIAAFSTEGKSLIFDNFSRSPAHFSFNLPTFKVITVMLASFACSHLVGNLIATFHTLVALLLIHYAFKLSSKVLLLKSVADDTHTFSGFLRGASSLRSTHLFAPSTTSHSNLTIQRLPCRWFALFVDRWHIVDAHGSCQLTRKVVQSVWLGRLFSQEGRRVFVWVIHSPIFALLSHRSFYNGQILSLIYDIDTSTASICIGVRICIGVCESERVLGRVYALILQKIDTIVLQRGTFLTFSIVDSIMSNLAILFWSYGNVVIWVVILRRRHHKIVLLQMPL